MTGALRGFAAMSPEKRREISAEGGRAAHEQGVAHTWSRAEAILAGRRGHRARYHPETPPADEETPHD